MLPVIFDLDNTLVDSECVRRFRDRRQWQAVRSRLHEIHCFPGIPGLMETLRRDAASIAVVTHSPRSYASSVLSAVGLAVPVLVCYHDLRGHLKPSPHGYRLALSTLGRSAALVVGDDISDLCAADLAGLRAGVAGWCREPTVHEDLAQDRGWFWFRHPDEVLNALR